MTDQVLVIEDDDDILLVVRTVLDIAEGGFQSADISA